MCIHSFGSMIMMMKEVCYIPSQTVMTVVLQDTIIREMSVKDENIYTIILRIRVRK